MLGAVDLFGRILIHTEHRNMSIGHDLRELLTGAHGTVDRISNRKKTSGESVSKISKWNLWPRGRLGLRLSEQTVPELGRRQTIMLYGQIAGERYICCRVNIFVQYIFSSSIIQLIHLDLCVFLN